MKAAVNEAHHMAQGQLNEKAPVQTAICIGICWTFAVFSTFRGHFGHQKRLDTGKGGGFLPGGARWLRCFSSLYCSSALIGLDKGHSAGVAWAWGCWEYWISSLWACAENDMNRYLLGFVARYRPRLKKPTWRKSSSTGITPLRMSWRAEASQQLILNVAELPSTSSLDSSSIAGFLLRL